jgi:hypothetical protein
VVVRTRGVDTTNAYNRLGNNDQDQLDIADDCGYAHTCWLSLTLGLPADRVNELLLSITGKGASVADLKLINDFRKEAHLSDDTGVRSGESDNGMHNLVTGLQGEQGDTIEQLIAHLETCQAGGAPHRYGGKGSTDDDDVVQVGATKEQNASSSSSESESDYCELAEMQCHVDRWIKYEEVLYESVTMFEQTHREQFAVSTYKELAKNSDGRKRIYAVAKMSGHASLRDRLDDIDRNSALDDGLYPQEVRARRLRTAEIDMIRTWRSMVEAGKDIKAGFCQLWKEEVRKPSSLLSGPSGPTTGTQKPSRREQGGGSATSVAPT